MLPPEVCFSKVVSKPYSVPSARRGHGFAALTRLRMADSAFWFFTVTAETRFVSSHVAG